MNPNGIREAIKNAETAITGRKDVKTLNQTACALVDALARIDDTLSRYDTNNLQAERADAVSLLHRLEAAAADPNQSGWLAATLRYIDKDYNGYLEKIKPVIKKLLTGGKTIDFETAETCFLKIFRCINADDGKCYDKNFIKKFYDILPPKCQGSALGLYVKQIPSQANSDTRKKIFRKIIDIDNNFAAAHYDLGVLFYKQREWQQAAGYFQNAKSKSDTYKSADLYFKLGTAQFKLKEWGNSEKEYRRCLELDENYTSEPSVDMQLGLCLLRQKKYDEAIERFDICIERGTDGDAPYRHRSDALEKSGRIDVDTEIESDYYGRFEVAQSDCNINRYPHQIEAINDMKSKIASASSFAGILMLPTGGGKTLTATYWLMRDILDKGGKVIWLAHRHELLNQARNSFKKVCYRDITGNKTSYNWRLISGRHDKPVNIKTTDDIIIASKTSVCRGKKYLDEWLKANGNDVFLVIDEAHHATANEYRKVIDYIKDNKNVKRFRMLGLTATPIRTADKERGLLKLVFPDDIVYNVDLGTLISRGILAKPVLKSVKTDVDMVDLLAKNNAKDVLSRIVTDNFFDIDTIGEETANIIAEHSQRNRAIVNEYINNRDKYKKTLVFALNRRMAAVLSMLFNDAGVRADYVMSGEKDKVTGATLGARNELKIKDFRDGKLDVLINVTILTEGTDLPQVQSVFLTRPTKSTILMTQMIGRALRGEPAGGTKEAYIVNFIDDWREEHIAWITPGQLFIDQNANFNEQDKQTRKYVERLISIAKIEEFAKRVNDTYEEDDTGLKFIERIPVGIYEFKYLIEAKADNDEDREKPCEIFVFDCMRKAYEEFLAWLPNQTITDVDKTADEVDELFNKVDILFGYRKEDIIDIIEYYKQTGKLPEMIELAERDKYDISSIAEKIRNDRNKILDIINEEWERGYGRWSVFFGISNKRAFRAEIDREIRIIDESKSKDYVPEAEEPLTVKESIKIKDLTLYDIRQRFPDIGRKLRDGVYSKFTDAEGYYVCAESGYRSKKRLDFQIHHITPMSEGGKTEPDNLQLLERGAHARKHSKKGIL